MSLVETVEALEGRELTRAERENLHKFEQAFDISEGDPLIVVLAMMAKNRLMVDGLPDLLQQKAKETIELHQQTLREQSTLIAKELLASLGALVAETAVGHKLRLAQFAGVFLAGFVLGGLCVRLLVH